MLVYDLVHGYQPFSDPALHFPWVEKNLKETFVPTSNAMQKGYVKRGIQIQGWTLESWHASNNNVQKMASEVIENLKSAGDKGYVEVGFSGYTHPILPVLSENLIKIQLQLDYEVVSKILTKPTWFWPPEGAVDKKVLSILFGLYPSVTVVIPDSSLGKRNYSGLINIDHGNGKHQKALVCNNVLKDTFMNAMFYKTSPNKELEMPWEDVKKIYDDPVQFEQMLNTLDKNLHVLARDWENAGAIKGLAQVDGNGLEIKGLLSLDAEFKLPSEGSWENAEIIELQEVIPGSWETASDINDPYVFWWPNKKSPRWEEVSKEEQDWSNKWKDFINTFNEDFERYLTRNGGLTAVMANEKTKEEVKSVMPALISCVPWHFLAKKVWGPDPSFSKAAWEKILIPAKEKLAL